MQTGNGFRPVRLPKDNKFFVVDSVRVRKCVPFFENGAAKNGGIAGSNMKQHSISPEHIGASNDLDSAVLDVQGFAVLAHIPKATILTLRSRSPDKLPPPFRQRPLALAHRDCRALDGKAGAARARTNRAHPPARLAQAHRSCATPGKT